MTDDLVKRLRQSSKDERDVGWTYVDPQLQDEAANEIERLREAYAQMRDEDRKAPWRKWMAGRAGAHSTQGARGAGSPHHRWPGRRGGSLKATEVDAVAEAWASIDGKLEQYQEDKAGKLSKDVGTFMGYQAEALELISRIEARGYTLERKGV